MAAGATSLEFRLEPELHQKVPQIRTQVREIN